MTEKEKEFLQEESNYTLQSLKVHELAELLEMATGGDSEPTNKDLMTGILKGYTLGFIRAERKTKRELKKKQEKQS